MNAYTLIDKLRKARRQFTITAGAQALFLELAAINNEEHWINVFRCPNGELCAALGISEKTLDGYRKELIAAGLIGYQSGKDKRTPSNYSLNGSSYDSSNGVLNGSKKEYHTVTETPDLNKEESKSKSKKEFEDVVLSERDIEINGAIENFTLDNAIAEYKNGQKEKNSAKKEKIPLPNNEEMIEKIIASGTCHWVNVIEFYLAKGVKWNKATELEKQVYYDHRAELFKKFYASKQDNYNIRLPSCNEIANNFYNWIPSELNRESLQKLNKYADPNNKLTYNSGNKSRSTANQERGDIASKSAEFLQKIADKIS